MPRPLGGLSLVNAGLITGVRALWSLESEVVTLEMLAKGNRCQIAMTVV